LPRGGHGFYLGTQWHREYANRPEPQEVGDATIADQSAEPSRRPLRDNVWDAPDRSSAMTSEAACDRAAPYIRSLIFSGRLRPGDCLPSGRDLSARFGISRVPLRLGLKGLEGAGYLEASKGAYGGPRVSDRESPLRCWTDWRRRSWSAPRCPAVRRRHCGVAGTCSSTTHWPARRTARGSQRP